MSKIKDYIFYIKWNNKSGRLYLKTITKIGFLFMTAGRKLMRNGSGRCSWCGDKCGFNSEVSVKGLRCDNYTPENCCHKPYV